MAFSIATQSLLYPLNPSFRDTIPTSLSLPLHLPECGQCHCSSSSWRSGVRLRASKTSENLKSSSDWGRSRSKSDKREDYAYSDSEEEDGPPKDYLNDPYLMTPEERREWRGKIRQFLKNYRDVEEGEEEEEEEKEQMDPVEKRNIMQKLLADYPLVVEEDDPDWPEDADGWGFNLGQFFNKITIKNNKKKDVDDDENYDSEDEIVWQDDNYIRPIKDITSAEWEEAVFKDISPLIVLVHHRYKRQKKDEKMRDELEKAVHIIWNCRLPSPRCVAVDAVVEDELALALKVHVFPEVIFTKAGKILYREKAMRSADELSKIMAFFYYGAAEPSFLTGIANDPESIPSFERT